MNPSEQAKIRRLRRLCLVLELDELTGELIVDLLERLERAELELERLRVFAGDRGDDRP